MSATKFPTANLAAIVRAAGREGIYSSQIHPMVGCVGEKDKAMIRESLARLFRAGQLVWVSEPGPRAPQRRRYYVPEFAPAVVGEATRKPCKAASPGAQAVKGPRGEVIVPSNVKRTVCAAPSFDVRYQIDPATRVVGGWATLGPGRYLDGGA